MNDDDKALLDDFLVEAREIIDRLDQDFVQLEKSPDDDNLLGNIFRGMHTLKGSSGFFAFKRLERLSHAGETLLGRLRDKSLQLTPSIVTALLHTLDNVRQIIDSVQAHHMEPVDDDTALLENLHALASGEEAAQIIDKNEVPAVLLPVELPTTTDPPAETVISKEVAPPVKVSVELLDRLMNLVSEMVLARNRLLSCALDLSDPTFTTVARHVDFITLELQERMLKTRMSPISQIWQKFPRLVRDLSLESNKRVELIQIGAETELDRTLLESIKDPLIHIIRNCIDHGIESEADRLVSGKNPIGSITLQAEHENGMVVIQVSDDGCGIDVNQVSKKAVARGLVTPEAAEQMEPDELLDLIFLPGFSTKETVTSLSGRGVGMDVVKTNIQRIGGSVELATTPTGTRLRLKIPLTLAIMPALFIRCAHERFAIPQNNLLEIVRYNPGEGSVGLENLYGTPVFRLRERLIPLIHLSQALNLPSDSTTEGMPFNIAILQASGIRFGLIVDEVLYMQEVVVKPIPAIVRHEATYGGATVLGDGRVALILDIEGMARNAGLSGKIKAYQQQENSNDQGMRPIDEHAMLVFDLEDGDRLAIPVDAVERLENISRKKIQKSGTEAVIPYGDGVIKLVWVANYIEGSGQSRKRDALSIIVHYADGLPIGLVVNQIHDIVHMPTQLNFFSPPQQGLLGCAVINGQVINVIDVQGILEAHRNRNAIQMASLPTNTVIEEPL